MMNTRLRRLLITALAAFGAALSIAAVESSVSAHAEVVCPTGTNWDNSIGACR